MWYFNMKAGHFSKLGSVFFSEPPEPEPPAGCGEIYKPRWLPTVGVWYFRKVPATNDFLRISWFSVYVYIYILILKWIMDIHTYRYIYIAIYIHMYWVNIHIHELRFVKLVSWDACFLPFSTIRFVTLIRSKTSKQVEEVVGLHVTLKTRTFGL